MKPDASETPFTPPELQEIGQDRFRIETLREKKRRLCAAQKYERKREYFLREQERRRAHPEFYISWRTRMRCFWSWPWGHVAERGMASYSYICLACGAYIDKSSGGY